MEEILEGAARIIWIFLGWLIWELLFQVVLFNIGRGFLLVVTFGRYPGGELNQAQHDRVMVAGLLVVVGALVAVGLANRYG